MIVSFGDRDTELLDHEGRQSKAARRLPPGLVKSALRKLDMLDAATTLKDLRSPPGNRLEALSGDLEGNYSIRINARWRIVFRWTGSEAHQVRVMDYHG